MREEDDVRRLNGWLSLIGRHVGTLLSAVLLAVLFWNWDTTQQMSVDFAKFQGVMETKMEAVNDQLKEIQKSTSDKYSATQAAKDQAAMEREIDRLTLQLRAERVSTHTKIDRIENRVLKLEERFMSDKKDP